MKYDFYKHINQAINPTITKIQRGGKTVFGHTDTFEIFNAETSQYLRSIIFDKDIMEKCKGGCPDAPYVMRNMTKYNSFLMDMQTCPLLQEMFSNIIGKKCILHPVMMERAHTNIQEHVETERPVFEWHFDAQAYVCIVNLSDFPENAKGGATIYDKEDGTEGEIMFYKEGTAYVFNGGQIRHKADPANYQRITMVTHLQEADVTVLDTTNIFFGAQFERHKPESRKELARQYFTYRINRIKDQLNNDSYGTKDLRRNMLREIDVTINQIDLVLKD